LRTGVRHPRDCDNEDFDAQPDRTGEEEKNIAMTERSELGEHRERAGMVAM